MTKPSMTCSNTKTRISVKLAWDDSDDNVDITLKYHKRQRHEFTLTKKQVNTLAWGVMTVALDDDAFYNDLCARMEYIKSKKNKDKQ